MDPIYLGWQAIAGHQRIQYPLNFKIYRSMKYSKAQQNSHLSQIRTIMAKADGSMGSRQICKELEEQGIHLSRGYVLKLMQKGEVLASQRRIDIENRKDDIQAWLEELSKLARDFNFQVSSLIRRYPPDLDDEDVNYLNELDEMDPADLSEEPRHN